MVSLDVRHSGRAFSREISTGQMRPWPYVGPEGILSSEWVNQTIRPEVVASLESIRRVEYFSGGVGPGYGRADRSARVTRVKIRDRFDSVWAENFQLGPSLCGEMISGICRGLW